MRIREAGKGQPLALFLLSAGIFFAAAWAAPGAGLVEQGYRAFYGGDMSRARELAESQLRLSPRDAAARILLARSLAGLGENERAFGQLRELLRMDPGNVDALFFLAALSSAMSQSEYAKLYRLAPDSARVHQLTGQTLQAQEKFELAEQEYWQALEADPELVEVMTALGDVLRTQGKMEEGLSYYKKVLAIDPGNFDALYGAGVCYRFQEQHAVAIQYFRRALERAPSFAAGHLALAISLMRTDAMEEAVSELQTAIRLEPEMDQAYYQLGRAYQALGDAERARQAFEEARRISTRDSSPPRNQ